MAEHSLARRSLVRYVLNPSSIAVVGASDNPRRIGGRPIQILLEREFHGRIYPVNPKYRTVQGLPCYGDVAALPEAVELCVVCLPAEGTIQVLEQAGMHGARAAVVFAGGFAETGSDGQALQEMLRQVADKYNMALVGPNSLGVASFIHSTYATFATALDKSVGTEPGDVALVSQSGGFAFNLCTEAYAAGARFSHVVATGNEAGLKFADYLAYLADDPYTASVIAYLEGVGDGARLADAFERLRRAGKPVFAIKTGVSASGSAAVASHTAQLSGNDAAYEALFARYGVTRLTTLEEAVDVARALRLDTCADGIAITTNSGGTAVYLADACEREGVPLAEMSTDTATLLGERLPSFVGVSNPLDITAQVINDQSLLAYALEALDADEGIDLLLAFLGSMEYLRDELLETLLDSQSRLRTPLLLSWYGVSESVRGAAAAAGLLVCADPARALRGLGYVRRGRKAVARARGSSTTPRVVAELGPVPSLSAHRLAPGRFAVDEWQTMQLLERYGVPTPRRTRVFSADQCRDVGERLGYPMVAKLLDPPLAHRARVGAVRTGLSDARALGKAFDAMRRDFDARSVLVAEQVPAGPELIIGVLADPAFGTRAVLGRGGIEAEEFADARTLVPPYDTHSVLDALNRLSDPRCHTDGVVWWPYVAEQAAFVLRVLATLIEEPALGITEVECNPVVLTPDGLVALDALAFVALEEEQP